jgi:hypothetical protein
MMGYMLSNVVEASHKNIGFEATFMLFFNGPRNELSNVVFQLLYNLGPGPNVSFYFLKASLQPYDI